MQQNEVDQRILGWGGIYHFGMCLQENRFLAALHIGISLYEIIFSNNSTRIKEICTWVIFRSVITYTELEVELSILPHQNITESCYS